MFGMMLIWSVSGIYLGIPDPFTATSEYFGGGTGEPGIGEWMDVTMLWLTRLHFGRWRNVPLQIVWVIIGLVPAVLFVSGTIMWWQRVMRKRNPQTGERIKQAASRMVGRSATDARPLPAARTTSARQATASD
jgi:uncharacterized iron-regulated membrane protein